MKRIVRLIAILASVAVLGGCASAPGPFVGLGNDVMSMLIIYRTDSQPLTKAQYDKVGVVAKRMGIQIGWQLSSPFEAAATSGGAYAAAGALGGATQGHFYPGAMVGAAAGYTAAVYGLGGVVNGLVTASYANVHAVALATEMALRDDERDGVNEFRRIHVVGAFVRSRNNTGNPAPELAKQMPDWRGPTAGTPVR